MVIYFVTMRGASHTIYMSEKNRERDRLVTLRKEVNLACSPADYSQTQHRDGVVEAQ